MKKRLSLVLLCGIMVVSTAYAGGSIFGGHHKKKRNADGVSSVGMQICGSLACSDVIIKQGNCEGIAHATQQYGVCVCDDGYKVKDGECILATQANCTEPGEKWCSALNNCIDSNDCCKYLSVSDCQECDSETGEITNKNDGLCKIGTTANAGYCFDGECLNPCEENSIDNCKTCTPVSGNSICTECNEGYTLDETNHTCFSGKFQGANGVFYDCSNNSLTVVANAAECTKCDNTATPREMVTYEGNQYCSLVNCPDGYWKGTWQDNDAVCFSCSESNGWISTTTEECSKCNNTNTPRKIITSGENEYCAIVTCPDGKFQVSYGACKDCSTTSVWSANELECARCGNTRKMVDDKCVPASCPDGEFQSVSGYCQKCSITAAASATAEQCARCDSTDTPREMNGEYCTLITCPEGYFQSIGGACSQCSTMSDQSATAEECAKCDDTDTPRKRFEITLFGTSDHCGLVSCPDGYWQTNTGTCAPCNTGEGYTPNTENECSKCDDTDTPRKLVGEHCARATCPDGMYLYNGFSCGSCSSPSAFDTSKEECDKCGSQRTYNTETKKCSLAS